MPDVHASVGKYAGGTKLCYNREIDQQTVQGLLNKIPRSQGGAEGTLTEGTAVPPKIQTSLFTAILNFQRAHVVDGLSVDGHVDPHQRTIALLNQLAAASSPVLVLPEIVITGDQDERVIFRKTVEIIKKKVEPGEPDTGATRLLIALTAIAHDLSQRNQRIANHPLETGDPDFGDEKSRRQRLVVHELILLKVDVAVKVESLPPERFIGFFKIVRRITREYTYEYGAGLPDQQVIVNRTVTIIDNPVSVPIVTKETSFAPQPSNFLNP